jgi:hypothetical protein
MRPLSDVREARVLVSVLRTESVLAVPDVSASDDLERIGNELAPRGTRHPLQLMATRMFFSSQNCQGVTLESGNSYNADRQGMISVESPRDIAALKAGGYVQAGGMPKLRRYFVCDACDWDAAINSCGRCGNTDLRKVEH